MTMPGRVFTIDDKAVVRINLGILGTLLIGCVGGTAYLNTLNSNVRELSDTMSAVKQAIDRNTAQQVQDGRALAILQTMVSANDSRLRALESAKGR
jgi:uncharacterized membrane protein YebE (DUF533 family)